MSKRIAITIDDAPLYNGTLFTPEVGNQMLIDALASVDAQVTFFVTPQDFSAPGSFETISAFNDAGHLIANHTNTHPAASDMAPDIYFDEIDLTETLISGFTNYRPWFRFPFLDEGNTFELRDIYRDGLAERGLSNGYVTADTFDWYMNARLGEAVANGDAYDLDALRDAYVEMIVTSAEHYYAMGEEYLGTSPAHLLLLHQNDLAAMFLDDAIEALRANGWEIISADEAYQDPLADYVPQTLATASGLLAAYAIDHGLSPGELGFASNTTQGIDAILQSNGVFDTGAITIEGTVGDDVLFGTDANETYIGNGGDDVFSLSGGDDIIIGDEGQYDQINTDGAAEDYTFTRNLDGTITVTGAGIGSSTLTSVEGVWFRGEEAWYNIDELVEVETGGDITGTAGNDFLYGTAGDDVMIGNGGSDKFGMSAGDDQIIGNADAYDQIDTDGFASDYTFIRNADGTITVTSAATGTDVLSSIEGVWFRDEAAWYDIEQLLQSGNGGDIVGTAGDDFLFGTSGDDVMTGNGGSDKFSMSAGDDQIIGNANAYDQIDTDGFASDYIFTRNADGTVTVTNALTGTDTLESIEGVWFRDEAAWYAIDDLIGG